MSDTVTVALITGCVTGVTSVLSIALTYLAARRQSDTALANSRQQAETALQTVDRQAQLELRRLGVEGERLRQQADEAALQLRSEKYQTFLAAASRFEDTTGAGLLDEATYREFVKEVAHADGGVELFGSDEVRRALADYRTVIESVDIEMGPDTDFALAAGAAFARIAAPLAMARKRLLDAMRSDLAGARRKRDAAGISEGP